MPPNKCTSACFSFDTYICGTDVPVLHNAQASGPGLTARLDTSFGYLRRTVCILLGTDGRTLRPEAVFGFDQFGG